MTDAPRAPRASTPRRLLAGAVLAVVGVVVGVSVALSLFLNSSRTIVLVGHDTVVSPTLGGDAVVQIAPILTADDAILEEIVARLGRAIEGMAAEMDLPAVSGVRT